MRKHKYRAFCELDGSMFGQDLSPQEFWSLIHPASDDVIVMEYTGLCDINDVEVYEGDIVKIHRIESLSLSRDLKYEVVFAQGFFGISSTSPLKDNISRAEVIGNVYEHPELLEQYC